jgi:hypothetical protein
MALKAHSVKKYHPKTGEKNYSNGQTVISTPRYVAALREYTVAGCIKIKSCFKIDIFNY